MEKALQVSKDEELRVKISHFSGGKDSGRVVWAKKAAEILLLFHSRFDFEQIDDKHPSAAHGRIWRSCL